MCKINKSKKTIVNWVCPDCETRISTDRQECECGSVECWRCGRLYYVESNENGIPRNIQESP